MFLRQKVHGRMENKRQVACCALLSRERLEEDGMDKCETCKYWEREEDNTGVVLDEGRCHAYAPRPTAGGVIWPIVNYDDWCGEHEPREKPLAEERRLRDAMTNASPLREEPDA